MLNTPRLTRLFAAKARQVNRCIALPAGFTLAPATALAHSPIEGIGDFYNGLLHPLLVPSHLLTLLALGLALGQRGAKNTGKPLLLFSLGCGTGLIINGLGVNPALETALLAVALVFASLTAARITLPLVLYGVMAGAAGLLIGLDSPQETLSGGAEAVALFGTGLSASLGVLYSAAIATYCQTGWQEVAVRVVGAWILAVSILVLALSLMGITTHRNERTEGASAHYQMWSGTRLVPT